MSTISNIHTAIVYESKGPNKSIAQFGQRGIVTIAKADSKGNYGQYLQQTMFTSVPTLTTGDIDFSSSRVQEHCVDYFKSIQNAIVAQNLKSGQNATTTQQLGADSICAYLETVNSPEKWDASRIATWFQDNLAEHIGVALITKGFSEEKLESSLKAYSKLFADTFSSKAAIPRIKALQLEKALALANGTELENDVQVCRFKVRVAKVLEEATLDEALGL